MTKLKQTDFQPQAVLKKPKMEKAIIETLNLILLNFERIVWKWQTRKNHGIKKPLIKK